MKGLTAMRKQILKISGVGPEQLMQLHEFLDEGQKSLIDLSFPQGVTKQLDGGGHNDDVRAYLLKSVYSSRDCAYTVTVQVPIAFDLAVSHDWHGVVEKIGYRRGTCRIAQSLVRGIYDALEIYPETQDIINKTTK